MTDDQEAGKPQPTESTTPRSDLKGKGTHRPDKPGERTTYDLGFFRNRLISLMHTIARYLGKEDTTATPPDDDRPSGEPPSSK